MQKNLNAPKSSIDQRFLKACGQLIIINLVNDRVNGLVATARLSQPKGGADEWYDVTRYEIINGM